MVGLGGLAGCAGEISGTGGGGGIDSLKVGVATSLSGPFAVFGRAELNGAKLAKQDLEEELDVSIEIATGDTEITPGTGLQRMKRLVTEDEIDFAMGGVSSAVAIKMGRWASDNGVTYFATGAHSDQITGGQCAKYMFRPTCSNSMLANTIGSEMAQAADNWYLMYSDYTWGQTAQKAVSRILQNNGKQVVGKSAIKFPNDDYTPFVNKAASADADGIGVLIAGLDMRKALRSIINKGLHKQRTLAMHQNEDVVYWGLGKETAGVLDMSGQVWGPALTNSAATSFAERVAQNYETDPYVRHYLGYVSMDQAVRAAVRAESTAAEDMRSALEGHKVGSKAKDIKGADTMYWRECDHQLIQPAYSVKAMSPNQMQDNPYKKWFSVKKTFAGDDVARACDATGCSF